MKICVIDSDPNRLIDVEKLFKAMGHEVLCLDQVIGASNLIRKFNPDLLVVDVKMPTVSGPKLVQVLRANLPALPPLILYSDMEPEGLSAVARAAKADDYIVKNDDYLPLLSRVQYHLGRAGKNQGFPRPDAALK